METDAAVVVGCSYEGAGADLIKVIYTTDLAIIQLQGKLAHYSALLPNPRTLIVCRPGLLGINGVYSIQCSAPMGSRLLVKP